MSNQDEFNLHHTTYSSKGDRQTSLQRKKRRHGARHDHIERQYSGEHNACLHSYHSNKNPIVPSILTYFIKQTVAQMFLRTAEELFI